MRTLAPYSHFFNCYSKGIQGEIFPPQTFHALRGLTKCNHFYFFISFSHFDRVLNVNIFLLLQNIWICCLHHILGINFIVVSVQCWILVLILVVGVLKSSSMVNFLWKLWSSWPPFQCLVKEAHHLTHPYWMFSYDVADENVWFLFIFF